MTAKHRFSYLIPLGALLLAVPLAGAGSKVRIIQTNSAGDSVHLIDPATNKIVGEIKDIEVNHGAAAAPDGSRLYISNEAESTLDVVDAKTLKITKHIPLSGHPNNLSISRDGRRVYIAIAQAPGAVDVVDTASQAKVKTIPIEGAGHNTFVTPDGKFVVAGSVAGKTLTEIRKEVTMADFKDYNQSPARVLVHVDTAFDYLWRQREPTVGGPQMPVRAPRD